MSELVERLQTEEDLCRNEGADDIAALLADAKAGVVRLEGALTEIFGIIQDSVLEQNYRIRDIIANALTTPPPSEES